MTTISQQIKAIKKAKAIGPMHEQCLRDAATTLQALALIFGGGKEKLLQDLNNFSYSRPFSTAGEDMILFFKERGLDLNLIK